MRGLWLLLAVILLGAAPPRSIAPHDDAYFLGSWTCAKVPWTFAHSAPHVGWIRTTYGNAARPDGTAVIGYVAGLHAYVYRDFHADGGYAELSSPRPVRGRWVWLGTYYPPVGATLGARITYVQHGAGVYERIFDLLRGGLYVKVGTDRCVKT